MVKALYSSEDDQFRPAKKPCSSPDNDDNVVMAAEADDKLKVDDDEELAKAVAVDGDEAEVVAPVQPLGLSRQGIRLQKFDVAIPSANDDDSVWMFLKHDDWNHYENPVAAQEPPIKESQQKIQYSSLVFFSTVCPSKNSIPSTILRQSLDQSKLWRG